MSNSLAIRLPTRVGRNLRCWVVVLLVPAIFACSKSSAIAQNKIDFGSQIKPILSDNCYACHGPDEAQRTTDFRLDQKESALDPDFSVIVPTDPESSLLIERILSKDPDEVMPPADHRKHLNESQKKVLVEWVRQGAQWSEHWAFQKPTTRAQPKTTDKNWPLNFIDYFILDRLEKENIKPSAVAATHVLLRRLSFDLTGLPPTPDEVNQFKKAIATDGFEKAYRRSVERLLASPHFGERMAVYWLDLVRYADTVGYHGDQNVSVSPYRDYVINAFNQNMRFDQFTREQLAGDLLENPTEAQQIASGYNRLGMMSAEGGVQPEEYLNKYASDRVRTTASVWLGVTLGCAECHDHKFDPFFSKEFYEFSAFFADIKEKGLYAGSNRSGVWGPSIDVADPVLAELTAPMDASISELESTLVETEEIRTKRVEWEADFQKSRVDWKSLEPIAIATLPEVKTKTTNDYAILVSGDNPKTAVYAIATNIDQHTKALRLEALPHKSLPKKGPGRAGNGNFVVSEFIVLRGEHTDKLETMRKLVTDWPQDLQSQVVKLSNATATIEQTHGGEAHPDKKWSAASAIDRDTRGSTWGWAVLPEIGKSHELVVQIADGESLAKKMTIVIRQQHENGPHLLGHFRLSQAQSANATARPNRLLPDNIQNLLKIVEAERSDEQTKKISEYYISIAPLYQKARKRIAKLKSDRDSIVKLHTRTTLVTVAVPPREIRVLARGDWMDKTGAVVQPSVPMILGGPNWKEDQLENKRATRLELANWIIDKNNPLTARVFVNRTWRMFFGNGISNVLDDLGSQGEPPAHPELLDQLSVMFVESGWDVKQLIRGMVLSNTYRQSSSLRDDLNESDPENRLLARQSRFRLDAEFIRDHALAVGGLLVQKSGGRSVMPYQPPGLYRHLNFPARKYQVSAGDDQYRRGLYTHWQRQFLHPAMKTFDAPSREECTAARPRSSTPLAALVMLNDPSYVEAARSLADLTINQHDDTSSRIDAIFERAFSRAATSDEKSVVESLLLSHLEFFNEHTDQAKKLVSIGQSAGQLKDLDAAKSESTYAERAAWTSVCRAVINMHEFVLRK